MKPFAFLTIVFCLLSSNSFGQVSVKTHPYASPAPMPEPTLFGAGVVSTPEDDLNAAFSPDGNTVYFTRNFPRNRLGVILFSNYKGKKWLEPQIASFSGTATDYDPFFAPDGSKIFFCTNRGNDGKPKADFDIWYVERTGTSWSEPMTVGAPVNSSSDE